MKLSFSGCWYAAVLPSGEYTVVGFTDPRIFTHFGMIQRPVGEQNFGSLGPLGIDITNVGGFKICGQPAWTGAQGTHLWKDGQWTIDPRTPWSLWACAFGPGGQLHVIEGPGTSQGWRGLSPEGVLILGDDTINEQTDLAKRLGVTRMWEWMPLGNIVIGQGDGDRCVALDLDSIDAQRNPFGTRYIIHDAPCRAIRAKRSGNKFGIALYVSKNNDATAFIYTLTLDEILALPKLDDVIVDPPPPPPPPPTEQKMEMPLAVYETYVECVEKFPHTGSDDDRRAAHRKAVETVRARHGERWVWKSEHNTGYAAASTDALANVPASEGPIVEFKRMKMFIWDMIDGTTRKPVPRHESEPLREAYVLAPPAKDWIGEPQQPERHVYDGGENDTGTCDICGQPRNSDIHIPPSDDNLEELRAQVFALQQEMLAMRTQQTTQSQTLAEIVERLDRIVPPGSGTDAELRARFEKLVSRLKGRTLNVGFTFGSHNHKILDDRETF